ncbi:MAG: hypothetical protein LKG11_04925 [Bacilli bacterium]|jgi:hypothetical protein|nr:hypothetical protein [Bacilli bacterium]
MKKRGRVWLSIFASVALIAGAAAAVYSLNKTVRDWVDSEIGKIIPATSGSTDGDAPTTTLSSGSLSAKVYGGTVFGAGGIQKSVQVGATKTVVFTIEPANATDKYVLVESSDPAKIAVSAGRVLSGSAVTLTLAAGEFSGTVNVTAHPEALASDVVTIPVTVYNFVTKLSLVRMTLADDLYSSYGTGDLSSPDLLSFVNFAGSDFQSQSSPFCCLAWDFPTKTVTWSFDDSRPLYLTLIFEVTASDPSALPSATKGPDGTSFDRRLDASDGHSVLIWYGNAKELGGYSSAASPESVVFEEASYSFLVGAYVPPTSLSADSSSVQFS